MRYPLPLLPSTAAPDVDVAVQMQTAAGAKLAPMNVTKPRRDFLATTVAGTAATFFRKALPMAVAFAIGMTPPEAPALAIAAPQCEDTVYVFDSFTDSDGQKLQAHVGEINAEWVIPYQVETGFTDIDYEIVDGEELTGSGTSPGSENDRIAWVKDKVDALNYTVEVGIKFGPEWTPDVSFAQLYLLARGTNQNFTGSSPSPDAERAYFEFGTGGAGNMSGAFSSLDTPLSGLTPTFATIDFAVEHTIQLRVRDGKGWILVDGVVLISNFDTTQIDPGFVGFMLLDDADDFGMVRLTHFKVFEECAATPTPPGTFPSLFDTMTGTAGTTIDAHDPESGGAWTAVYGEDLSVLELNGAGQLKSTDVTGAFTYVKAGNAPPSGTDDYSLESKVKLATGVTGPIAIIHTIFALDDGASYLGFEGGLLVIDMGIGYKVYASLYAARAGETYSGSNQLVGEQTSAERTLRVEVSNARKTYTLKVDGVTMDSTTLGAAPPDGTIWGFSMRQRFVDADDLLLSEITGQ